MIEVQDRMILLSGQTAKRFQQNVLHPPKNPARDQLFAELDAMQVVERTTKRLTIELPGFPPSFLHKEGGIYDPCCQSCTSHLFRKNSAKIFQNLLLKTLFLSIICIGK